MARPDKLHKIIPSLTRVFRRFWPYIREQRRLILVSLLALFSEVALRILEPWPLKFIFDRIIPTAPAGGSSGITIIDNLDKGTLLIVAAIGIVLFTGFRALASYGNTVGFALIGNRVLTKIRSELFRHLQFLSLSFHTRQKNGDMIVRVIGDVGLLKEVMVTAILPLLANIMILCGMVGIMFWLNWKLALVALSIFPLFWLTGVRLGQRIRNVSHQQRRRESAMASTAAETIGSIKIVQAMSLHEVFDRSFSSQNQKSLKEGVKAKRLAAHLERSVDVLIAFATAMVVFYGTTLVMNNILTPGDLLVFLSYLKSAFKPVRNFAKYTARLAKASAAGDRVMEVLDKVPEIRDLPGAVNAGSLKGNIRFKNVSFAYRSGREILHNISFGIEPGEQIALVGASGSGKSTLVSLFMRLYDPCRGTIFIDGKDIRFYTLNSLRARISMVLQDPLLFGTTIYDNIAYGSPEVKPEDVEAAALLANAHDFITALPEGYNTKLGERGVTLSNGQRQRIAIARAAIRQSPILILDEPTTGLDQQNEQEVLAALQNLSEGRTTILITHDILLAGRADRIFNLQDGCICEEGTHQELLSKNGNYAAFYRLQMESNDHHPKERGVYAISG